jgi:hypothetical protein
MPNKHYTVAYVLKKGSEVLHFDSEREACKFFGVPHSTISGCYWHKTKYRGYTVERKEPTTHCGYKTRLYKIWSGMHERCYRIKHMHYKDYGGRGIKVCKEWEEFTNFRDWAIQNGYDDKLTIDRINNNGDYEPNNCRWVTFTEQANNRRSNHIISVNGNSMTIAECSRVYNIPKSTIRWRETHMRDIITGTRMDGDNDD